MWLAPQSLMYAVSLLLSLRISDNFGLTGANHVFFVDMLCGSQWEEYTIRRLHRAGQRKEVHVHQFITPGTVEERDARLLKQKREFTVSFLADAIKIPTHKLEERVKERDLVYERGTPHSERLKYLPPSNFYLPTSEPAGNLGAFGFAQAQKNSRRRRHTCASAEKVRAGAEKRACRT